MGDKKQPASVEKIRDWLLKEIEGADACVLSLDTLIYGGIVPSRLHEESEETLLARADTVRELRKRNPEMKLYLFQLIMRCPDYSLSDEEPDYYDDCGRELHLFGRYTHKTKLGIMTKEDEADFRRVKEKIPKDVLQDFLSRREKNLNVLLHDLELIRDGTADYFIVPQDDAAVYGFTSMDQIRVREFLKTNALHMKTAMYPSADDTGLTLIGRALNELNGRKPKFYVHFASTKAGACVPWFEDRAIAETVKYHILAVGGQQVYSLPEADILLALNMASEMKNDDDPARVQAYDVDRNLAEFVAYLEYALEEGKLVALGDVAVCNGSDGELLSVLHAENLLLKLHSYAAWNTSSNTIGTAVAAAVAYDIGRDEKGRINFLLHRYYEDRGYMGHTRAYVTEKILPKLGLNYFRVDGKNGKAAKAVKEELERFMGEEYPELSSLVEDISIEMPWRRMFETRVNLILKEEIK